MEQPEPPANPAPAAPIEAVVWLEPRSVGPTPPLEAVHGLARAIGLEVREDANATLDVAGDGDAMQRFLAGLVLRGAAVVRSQAFGRPMNTRRRALIHLTGAPEAPLMEL